MKNRKLAFLFALISVHMFSTSLLAQPKPGDVFREYIWTPQMTLNEGGKFLRVGGKLDYKTNKDHFPESRVEDGHISFDQYIDIKNALKAELVLEKVGSHEDTKNLRVSINKNPSITINIASNTPDEEADYMHHNYPVTEIPLEQLRQGKDNTFRLDVDKEQRWNWPQNIIYGVVLRVYYPPEIAKIKTVISGIEANSSLKEKQHLSIQDPNLNLRKVEYIGYFEDINYEGDGIYKQWHYHYFRGQVVHNLGSSNMYPFDINWDTQWVPDQSDIKVAARITGNNGLIYFTEAVSGVRTERDYSVELVKPYDQPKNWVTREDEFTSKLDITTNPEDVVEARMYWTSWSPCYANGIYINDYKVWDKEGPCYEYVAHDVRLQGTSYFKKGVNILKTGKEPLHDGQMVHGMEVQWPGIMLKIKSQKNTDALKISETSYEGRPHFLIETKEITYYYDIAGGGFSRIIDQDGNDWINFKMEPWGTYPEAAASAFRGLPNLVFSGDDDGAGHPGHNKCKSIVNGSQIITTSLSGKWQWSWNFNDSYAELHVLRTDQDRNYWFLYEGTPGGSYDYKNTYYGTNLEGPKKLTHDYYKNDILRGNFRWIYTGRTTQQRTMYFVQQESDANLDMVSLLGNSKNGLKSKDGMTVFGFGRGEGTDAMLSGPKKFILGFYPKAISTKQEHNELAGFLQNSFLE